MSHTNHLTFWSKTEVYPVVCFNRDLHHQNLRFLWFLDWATKGWLIPCKAGLCFFSPLELRSIMGKNASRNPRFIRCSHKRDLLSGGGSMATTKLTSASKVDQIKERQVDRARLCFYCPDTFKKNTPFKRSQQDRINNNFFCYFRSFKTIVHQNEYYEPLCPNIRNVRNREKPNILWIRVRVPVRVRLFEIKTFSTATLMVSDTILLFFTSLAILTTSTRRFQTAAKTFEI